MPALSPEQMHPVPDSVHRQHQAEKNSRKSTLVKKAPRKKDSVCLKITRRLYPPFSAMFVLLTCAVYRFLPQDHPWNYSTHMMRLSYPVTKKDGTVLYGKGVDDVPVVVFLVLCMFCCRYLVTEYVFAPLAHLMGTQKKKKGSFLDMGWQFVWYTASWLASAYFVSTETGFVFDNMWKGQNNPNLEDTPQHLYISWSFKLYYLAELAFWLSMIFTTVLEKWRKDFPEMMIHHFMTSGMIYYSYKTNFTAVGVFILFEQDLADIFLPLAKMAKYSKMDDVADIFFAVFAVAWIPTRHVFFFYIYHSIWTSAEQHPVEVANADPSKGAYFDEAFINKWLITLGLFQCLLLVWLKALLFAVYKALCGESKGKVEDHRSESDVSDSDADKSVSQLLWGRGDDTKKMQ